MNEKTEETAPERESQPVLMLVHVTDLHVKSRDANAFQPTDARHRLLARIENKDLFGFREGTKGHFRRAPQAFKKFLQKYRENLIKDDPRWGQVPTWLVDTGDLTTFGDPSSMHEGREYLASWRQALGTKHVMSLYGNHDAWPRTLPLPFLKNIAKTWKQKGWVQTGEWTKHWNLNTPLQAPIPGTQDNIILYGLDTVAWSPIDNLRAIGRVKDEDLKLLGHNISQRKKNQKGGGRDFNILAMHHPLAFPWTPEETTAINGTTSVMKLIDAENIARTLRGSRSTPSEPWAHLILSGHTHRSHPAILDENWDVATCHQLPLGDDQLQLVGGSLMLNAANQTPNLQLRATVDFSNPTLDAHPCQAQILLFLSVPEDEFSKHARHLDVARCRVVSVDGGNHYTADKIQGITMNY